MIVLLDDMGIIVTQYGINIATNEIKETDYSVPQVLRDYKLELS